MNIPNAPNPNAANPLDRIRVYEGAGSLKSFFQDLLAKDPQAAVNMLNDANLRFTSLFVLQPELDSRILNNQHCSRNQIALEITNSIEKRSISEIQDLQRRDGKAVQTTLRWMLQSGRADDGLSKEYDNLLDRTAILLVKLFDDKTVLHDITELMFSRYARGSCTNELIWAFFEYRDPYTLIPVAGHLLSGSETDAKLACKLLGFIPFMDCKDGIESGNARNRQRLYANFMTWFHNNCRFLYYTGESFQQTPHPIPYAVNRGAKYLCRSVSPVSGKVTGALSEDESMLLEKFMALDEYARTMLSDYSYLLRQNNRHTWNKWLHRPVSEQLAEAAQRMGGIL